MSEGETILLKSASANGGVFYRDEALALGMSSRTIDRRVAAGHFLSVGAGVLALPGIAHNPESLLRAATVALDGTASHQSAGRLHGLHGLGDTVIAVSVPIRRSNRFLTVTVHQLTDLEKGDVMVIRGIPTTDPTRTAIDLAAVLKERDLADIVDQIVRMGLSTYEAISRRLEELARRGKPGVVNLRTILARRVDGQENTESSLESRLTAILVGAGLPAPVVQFRPAWLRYVSGRVDLAYPEARLIVEGDSRRWHDSPEAFQLDRRRDNLAQLAGWRILRFTWDDITKHADYVAETVATALAGSL
jgi:very-short-patch-repair endonuclease